MAIIVPRAASVRADELDDVRRMIRADIDQSLTQLPSYYRLTDFIISLDPLPRTRLGKIQRRKLADFFDSDKQRRDTAGGHGRPIPIEAMAPEDRQLLEDPLALHTWAWLADRFSGTRLTPDTNMSLELGLDSLAWLTVTLELRDRIGVELPDEAIGRIATVRDLLRESVEAKQATGPATDPAVRLTNPDDLLDPEQRRWLTERGWWLRKLGTLLFALNRLFVRIFFSLEVRGVERIPRQGPCVLAPNHASLVDPPVLIAALPDGILNETYWGEWTGIMFRNAVMRLISRATQVLPIDQSSRRLTNLALGAAVLARGNKLIWFPEGGRSHTGALQPFQPGIGLILTAHPTPIVPVRISGSFEALPIGSWRPRRGRIHVVFGEVIDPRALAGQSEGADRYRRMAAALHDRVAELNGRSGSHDS